MLKAGPVTDEEEPIVTILAPPKFDILGFLVVTFDSVWVPPSFRVYVLFLI